MIRRTILAGLATAALTSATLALAGPAHAADSSDSCTITAIVPHRVVIGITGQQVQFGLKTTCDDQDIKFAVWGAGIATSAHTFWFTACNYDLHPGPTNFNCNDEARASSTPSAAATRLRLHPGQRHCRAQRDPCLRFRRCQPQQRTGRG